MKNLLLSCPSRRSFQPRAAVAVLALILSGHAATAQLYNGSGSTLYQGGNMYVGGTFENAGTYVPSTGTYTVANGDFLITPSLGTIGAGTGSVSLTDASAARTLGLSGQKLPSLLLDVAGGTTMSSNGGIGTSLELTTGDLRTTNAYTLTLDPSAIVNNESNAHYARGRVSQTKSLSGSTAVDFGKLGFTVNPAGQSFSLTMQRRAGLSLSGVSYGQNPTFTAYKSIDRVWALSSAGTVATPVTMTLSWLSDNDNGLTFSGTNAQAWRSDDNGATWVRQNAAADGSARSMTITTTVLNALYTVSTSAAPLPVELLAFGAVLVHDDGVLNWRTASEKNSAYFEVQASTDGRTGWLALGQVAAAGSSNHERTYGYTDACLSRYHAAVVYYRLRQVDLNGTVAYAPMVSLRPAPVPPLALELWPNPTAASSELRIRAAGTEPVLVSAYDAMGRLLFKQAVAPASTLRVALPSADWATGAYVLRAQQGKQTATAKLVKE